MTRESKKYVFICLLASILWLQPWESPEEKISDEWDACNSKYNNKCAYIGSQFETNTIEMGLSVLIHGRGNGERYPD